MAQNITNTTRSSDFAYKAVMTAAVEGFLNCLSR